MQLKMFCSVLIRSFPSDISCVDSDSEDSDDSLAEAFRPLDESGERYVCLSVCNFVVYNTAFELRYFERTFNCLGCQVYGKPFSG